MKTASIVLACIVILLLFGCGWSGKKSEDVKQSSDIARKATASGNIELEAYSDQPNAVTTIQGDGIHIAAPGKVNAKIGFNTDENTREKSDSDTHSEFYKQTSLGLKILAVVLICAGLFLAIKFSPILGLSVAGVGAMLLALEIYPWLLFVVLGAVALGAGYLIYEKYATTSKKSEAENTINKLKDALTAAVKAIETKAGEMKEEITNAVKENANDPEAVKDTITEIKRS